jgi:ribose 5-phosphate isomerase RpiB
MANVITLAEYTENLEEILDSYINTENSKEERHLRRVEKIAELENE